MEINKITLVEKMHELEKILGLTFNNIENLSNAMNRTEVETPYKNKTYFNEYYALIGDAIIKIALSEYLFSLGKKTPGEITKIKQGIEDNDSFHNITEKERLFHYAFNKKKFYLDSPRHDKVSYNNHDSFIEAIVAAIYYDIGIDEAKKWIKHMIYLPIF